MLRHTLRFSRPARRRRGAIIVLAAFLMIAMLGFVAFSVDLGWIVLVKTELQNAADSAALAAGTKMSDSRANMESIAQNYAGRHTAGGQAVALTSTDIEYGLWDSESQSFVPSTGAGNALRITARRNDSTGGNTLFFAKVLGRDRFDVAASAIALGNPRDICLVVDLSGSMNDDTEPGYSGDGTLSGDYATERTEMMQELFDDLNFGAYPGTQQSVGQPLGVSTFSSLSSSTGPLRDNMSVSTTYRITSGNSSSTRQTKAYRWMIDYQVATIMPNVSPTPNSGNTASYNYWRDYLEAVTGQSSSSQNIGYRTYAQFLMDQGRDVQVGSQHSQLSTESGYCAYHNESVGGTQFSFPPREYPTHACRRSLIAAIQEIKAKNASITDMSQRDWVSIVTFDTVAGTTRIQDLTGDYDAAMLKCTELQACSDSTWSTATESGLIGAKNHLTASGRSHTTKVVVLLTDGMPNLKTSGNTTISNYRTAHPSDYYYGGTDNYNHDAALMQVNAMQATGWITHAVGVGLATDDAFMDKIMQMSTLDDDATAPDTSGDPSEYETELRAIFEQIVDSARVRLVQ